MPRSAKKKDLSKKTNHGEEGIVAESSSVKESNADGVEVGPANDIPDQVEDEDTSAIPESGKHRERDRKREKKKLKYPYFKGN